VSDMNRTFTAVTLTAIVLVSVLIVSFAYSGLLNTPEHESPVDTSTSTNVDSSSPSVSPNQESNLTASSPSQPATSSSNSSSVSQSTSSAAPAQTQAPEPTFAPDSSYPEGTKDWLPWGSFGMFSPANQTYTTNNLILNVTGGAISSDAYTPILSYSLDGGQRVLVPITLTKPEGLGLTFQRVISGLIALPPLSNGSHVLVLFGDLGFESRRGKVTVYFAVQAE